MKKIALAFVLAAILATGTAFASPVHPAESLGIGVKFGGNFDNQAFDQDLDTDFLRSLTATVRFPNIPLFFGVNFGWGSAEWDDINRVGVSIDSIFLGSYFGETNFGWFTGLGIYVDFTNFDDLYIGFGGRFPVGLTWQMFNFFEIFGNVVGHFGTGFQTGQSEPALGEFGWRVGFELGLRIWL